MRWRALGGMVPVVVAYLCAPIAFSHGATPRAPATSLRISYNTRSFKLSFTLECDPASGTVSSPSRTCGEIARVPAMVFPPPTPPGIRSCPAPDWTVAVRGHYRGRLVDALFGATCGNPAIADLWLRFLPSREQLESVRIDSGLGPLHLGESAASVRALLGPADEVKHGVQVYDLHTVLQVHQGVPAIYAVGYGREGRVSTLIYNGGPRLGGESLITFPPGKRSPASHWPPIRCDGRAALVDHPTGRTMTIVWSSIDHPTAIVTSARAQACTAAAATAPSAVPLAG